MLSLLAGTLAARCPYAEGQTCDFGENAVQVPCRTLSMLCAKFSWWWDAGSHGRI